MRFILANAEGVADMSVSGGMVDAVVRCVQSGVLDVETVFQMEI